MTWYRDDPSGPQLLALKDLAATPKGGAWAKDLKTVRLNTLRAMHRLGMITSDTSEVTRESYVRLTEHGRNCSLDAK